jgi:transcriptional regulator with GAF, ATPase, and Fis domain
VESTGICVHDAQAAGSWFPVNNVLFERRGDEPREKSRLKFLMDLACPVLSEVELRDFLREAVASIRRLISSDASFVFLKGRDEGELDIYALDSSAGATSLQERTAIPIEGTIAGRVFQTGKLWAGTREQAPAGLPGTDPDLLMNPFRVGCMLPIPGRTRVLGTLGLVRCEYHPYDMTHVFPEAVHRTSAVLRKVLQQHIASLCPSIAT